VEHGRLRVIVLAAAGEPSSRTHSLSRAARITRGSLSWPTGSEARSSQASALTVTGSGARDRRGGLNAYPYRAARTLPVGGLRPVSLVSSGVTVANASARPARECGARCGHFISA